MKKLYLFLLFIFAFYGASLAQNWTPMAAGLLPANRVIFSISAVGDDVVWAVASGEYYQPPVPASHKPIILRSSNGGQSWSVHEIEEAAGSISFQIVAVDSLTAWITTQDFGSGAGRILYQTTDGGDIWTNKLANVSAGVALNRFPDGQHWLAHNRQTTSRSANDGASWTNSSISGYLTDEFQLLTSGANMSCTVGDTLWNGTSSGRIVRFTNYGQTATFINANVGTASSINSVAFQDHLNGLMYFSGSFLSKIAKSTDGGNTWTMLPVQPGNLRWNICAVPGALGSYAVASDYNGALGKIAFTKDFGQTWTVENINKSLNSIVFTSPTSGWVGAGRIANTSTPALYKYQGASLVSTRQPESNRTVCWAAPNPATDIIRFGLENETTQQDYTVLLSDMGGNIVFQGQLSVPELNVSRLPTGLYFLKIQTANGWAISKLLKS